MTVLTLGPDGAVEISNPQLPEFIIAPTMPGPSIFVPVAGPAGKDGVAGAASDVSIATAIAEPSSQTHAALIPVIDDEVAVVTDPPISLVLLFENAKA